MADAQNEISFAFGGHNSRANQANYRRHNQNGYECRHPAPPLLIFHLDVFQGGCEIGTHLLSLGIDLKTLVGICTSWSFSIRDIISV
jgi:hypothetical protein